MTRRIVYREVPKPPGPSGSIGAELWRALCERVDEEPHQGVELYLELADIDWLNGYAAGTRDDSVKQEIEQLVKAISKLGQVEVAWVTVYDE